LDVPAISLEHGGKGRPAKVLAPTLKHSPTSTTLADFERRGIPESVFQ